uniref:BHLH domain-containing protein n=1 Tax=Cucumis melo TaxID=3656 RepID=A0A9I9EAJ7_CUCME
MQTVVCIPLMDGVVELGSTDKVKEDMAFIQHIKSIFIETERRCEAQKPALSELSTSNSATSLDHFYYKHLFHSTNSSNRKESELEDEMDSDSSTSNSSNSNAAEGGGGGCPCWPSTVAGAVMASKPSELIMQLEPSEDIRLGSPDDASNNFFPNLSHSQSPPPELNTNFDYHLPSNTNATTQLQLPTLGYSSAAEAVMTEDQDTHYTNMLSAILNLNQNHQSSQWLNSSAVSNITCSTQSAFSKWTHHSDGLYCVKAGTASTSQCLLKSILHTIPFLHNKHHREQNLYKFCDGQSQNGISQDFLANPESLNDKFIILRSAVPFTTKMDKASILGDTVEYLEQLRQKVQDLEAQNLEFQSSRRISFQEVQRNSPVPRTCLDKRKLRILEGVGDGCTRPKMLKLPSPPTPLDTNLQVSIIGGDGLLELQCPYKEGLLLDILLILQGLQIETTAVRSSVSNGIFIAELRAKVKEDTDGKKASILEVIFEWPFVNTVQLIRSGIIIYRHRSSGNSARELNAPPEYLCTASTRRHVSMEPTAQTDWKSGFESSPKDRGRIGEARRSHPLAPWRLHKDGPNAHEAYVRSSPMIDDSRLRRTTMALLLRWVALTNGHVKMT